MKVLSIRLCLILSLALIIIVAVLSSGGTIWMLAHSAALAEQNRTVVQTLLANSAHWSDPAWQNMVHNKLASLDMAVAIHDTAGHLTYQSGIYTSANPVFQEVIVTDGVHQLGTAFVYDCSPTNLLTTYTILFGLFALFLTLAGVVWFIAWTILKPLAAITRATKQVAQNDLNFHFPTTRVREVAEAFQSFMLMGEALRTSLVRQAEVEQERRLLISAVAHDLRTPLFSLRGYLEGLSMGIAKTPEKAARYIEVCQTKAAALERLIADLFAYTQLEYLEQIPRQESLEIDTLIAHTLESLQPQAQGKNITFTVDAPSMPCTVQADAHLLTRVFENLLDNALRYTPDSSSIRIIWYREQDQLIFKIVDSGPGIAPADLLHLFAPLYRGEPSRSRRTGGSGLGLTIAQRILRAHGGDLTATNASGGGAIFSGSLKVFPRYVKC